MEIIGALEKLGDERDLALLEKLLETQPPMTQLKKSLSHLQNYLESSKKI